MKQGEIGGPEGHEAPAAPAPGGSITAGLRQGIAGLETHLTARSAQQLELLKARPVGQQLRYLMVEKDAFTPRDRAFAVIWNQAAMAPSRLDEGEETAASEQSPHDQAAPVAHGARWVRRWVSGAMSRLAGVTAKCAAWGHKDP